MSMHPFQQYNFEFKELNQDSFEWAALCKEHGIQSDDSYRFFLSQAYTEIRFANHTIRILSPGEAHEAIVKLRNLHPASNNGRYMPFARALFGGYLAIRKPKNDVVLINNETGFSRGSAVWKIAASQADFIGKMNAGSKDFDGVL